MKKIFTLGLMALLALPASGLAAGEDVAIQELQKQIQKLSAELDDLSDRLDGAERHATLDRIEFSGDLRTKADSLHYKDITLVQPPMVSDGMGGYLPNMNPDGTFKRQKFDLNNDVLYTTRLRLNMKAKVWDNVKFSGRLTMYKNWGDSTGVKEFDSWNTYTMDGTNSGNTSGDTVHVERAYFDWSSIGGTPLYLSIGRRPSTYGVPSNFRENELRGGTPSGHVVNFNFDGITVGYGLEDLTGIPGMTARFCYGQGYESEYGNGELFNEVDVEDTHLGGFNIDLFNDGETFLQLTAFRAEDLTDGFKGVLAVPAGFGGSPMPGFNLVSRYSATTNIGDMYLMGLGFAREEENGFKWFGSLGWTQTDPNGDAGMFGGLLSDMDPMTGQAAEDKTRDGYSAYVGIQTPAPMGKFGLEYNYGSKYWMPFTQAQDDVVGSKLAARGHVGEAYYIFDINPNMFLKVGAIYYDYQYTGSGAPVGKPQKIKDVQDGKAYSILPAVDEVWDFNASMTMKF
jgi:hypothetical protein